MKTPQRQMLTAIATAALIVSPALSLMSADASAHSSADGPHFAPRSQAVTRLITKQAPDGADGSSDAYSSAVSANCHAVTFDTYTPQIVGRSTTVSIDHVYLRLRGSRQVRLVDRGFDTSPANGFSRVGSISKSGQTVAYTSIASNLVRNDTNDATDVFVRDIGSRHWRSQLISIAADGGPANGQSGDPSMSASGRFVAFESYASNLVANDTNGTFDIFIRDRANRTTERVSVGPDATQADGRSSDPAISGNGRYVAYQSDSPHLVPGILGIVTINNVFRYDRVTGTTELVSSTVDEYPAIEGAFEPSISKSGRYIAFTSFSPDLVRNDTNHEVDVFVRDMDTGSTTRVSVTSAGAEASGVSPSLSGDGQVVAFESAAANLVPHDTNGLRDVFLHRLDTGATRRVSVSTTGQQGDAASGDPSISTSGVCISFTSEANNLVRHDANPYVDVFLRRLAF